MAAVSPTKRHKAEPLPRYTNEKGREALDKKGREALDKKGRQALEKMLYQTRCAVRDPSGTAAPLKALLKTDRVRVLSPKQEETQPASQGTSQPTQPEGAQHQGSKPFQEDRLLAPMFITFRCGEKEVRASLFGLFDGHGDQGQTVDFVLSKLPAYLSEALTANLKGKATIAPTAVGDACTQVMDRLAKECQQRAQAAGVVGGGTTVCCALRIGDKIFVINVGDSRAVLVRKEDHYQVTEDASLSRDRFTHWHLERGNLIKDDRGMWRVYGPGMQHPGMGLAAAVGCRPWMRSKPKISLITVGEGSDDVEQGKIYCQPTDRLIFVSDGVTPYMTTDDLVREFRSGKGAKHPTKEVVQMIADLAGLQDFSDNASVYSVPISSTIPA